jgi:hypothetical protein
MEKVNSVSSLDIKIVTTDCQLRILTSLLGKCDTLRFDLVPNFSAKKVHRAFQSSLFSREATDRHNAVGQTESQVYHGPPKLVMSSENDSRGRMVRVEESEVIYGTMSKVLRHDKVITANRSYL